ncbi:MAG TPA: glycine dehydrogenase, partial [Pirellulales bacterium]|nr:glycine dehydrogenase [Pirellulales bacterium]
MPYLLNTEADRREMLEAIGIDSIDELFANVPKELQLDRPLDIPPAMSELELTQHMQSLAAKNSDAG